MVPRGTPAASWPGLLAGDFAGIGRRWPAAAAAAMAPATAVAMFSGFVVIFRLR
jgi:hypothetical protein